VVTSERIGDKKRVLSQSLLKDGGISHNRKGGGGVGGLYQKRTINGVVDNKRGSVTSKRKYNFAFQVSGGRQGALPQNGFELDWGETRPLTSGVACAQG